MNLIKKISAVIIMLSMLMIIFTVNMSAMTLNDYTTYKIEYLEISSPPLTQSIDDYEITVTDENITIYKGSILVADIYKGYSDDIIRLPKSLTMPIELSNNLVEQDNRIINVMHNIHEKTLQKLPIYEYKQLLFFISILCVILLVARKVGKKNA